MLEKPRRFLKQLIALLNPFEVVAPIGEWISKRVKRTGWYQLRVTDDAIELRLRRMFVAAVTAVGIFLIVAIVRSCSLRAIFLSR